MYFPPKELPHDTRPWEEMIALSLWEQEADSGSCPFLNLSFLFFKMDMITCTSPGGYGGSMSPPAGCKQESLELFPPDKAEAGQAEVPASRWGRKGRGSPHAGMLHESVTPSLFRAICFSGRPITRFSLKCPPPRPLPQPSTAPSRAPLPGPASGPVRERGEPAGHISPS